MNFASVFQDKKFLKWMFALSLPIALQNLINASVNTMDTMMVGQLGEVAIASVGLANQIFFILSLILFGIGGGCNIFVAQFWGRKDTDNIRRTLFLSVIIAVLPSILFTAAALGVPQWLMKIFSDDPEVIDVGCKYLRIIAISYIPCAVSFTVSGAIRTIERPKLPLIMSIASLVINTTLNYLLIFGKFGLPKLGVEGAAIATTVTRLIELAVLVTALYIRFGTIAAKFRDFSHAFERKFVSHFVRTAAPVILNETTWGLGVALYSVIFSRMGTGVVAAMNINKVFENLFNAFFFGMSYAAGVMVGKTIGEGKEDLAREYGKKIYVITPLFNLITAALIIICSPLLVSIYNVSEAVRFDAIWLLIITAIYQPIRNTNLVEMVGVLRSGGDTKLSLILDLMGVWVMALPIGALCGLVLHWNILAVYPLMLTEEIMKFTFVTWRLKKGNWVKNLVRHL